MKNKRLTKIQILAETFKMDPLEYYDWAKDKSRYENFCQVTGKHCRTVVHHVDGLKHSKRTDPTPQHFILIIMDTNIHTGGPKNIHSMSDKDFQEYYDVNVYEIAIKNLIEFIVS